MAKYSTKDLCRKEHNQESVSKSYSENKTREQLLDNLQNKSENWNRKLSYSLPIGSSSRLLRNAQKRQTNTPELIVIRYAQNQHFHLRKTRRVADFNIIDLENFVKCSQYPREQNYLAFFFGEDKLHAMDEHTCLWDIPCDTNNAELHLNIICGNFRIHSVKCRKPDSFVKCR